jgi:hypothetical protein
MGQDGMFCRPLLRESNTFSVAKSCNYSRMTQNVKQIYLAFSLLS